MPAAREYDPNAAVTEKFDIDQYLFYFIGAGLVVFYFVIMWIVKSSDEDRATQLESSKKGYD